MSKFSLLVVMLLITVLSSSWASFSESSNRSCNSVMMYPLVVFTLGMFTSLIQISLRIVPGPLTERSYNNWNGLDSCRLWGTSIYTNRKGLISLVHRQGSHKPWKSLKVLEFFCCHFKPWKVLKYSRNP